MKFALDKGINFIDTADEYSLGESETLVGNALKGVRTEIVLATKVRLPMSDNLNRSGATRVNIMAKWRRVSNGCRPITSTSTRCTVTATRLSRRQDGRLTMSCARGKVRYIGLSN